jgi:hypothetical protein
VFLSERGDGHAHARTGREPVVHEDDGTAGDIGRRPVPTVLTIPPLELALLGLGDH